MPVVSQAMAASDHIPLLPVEELERRVRRRDSRHAALWDLLDVVKDPEIPVISIWELGVLQNVELEDGEVIVTITPTYSGCPAMDVIREEIGEALVASGHPNFRVVTRLSPAWSSQWMDRDAREKLRNYGIAPPGETSPASTPACPRCASQQVKAISEFGSTACKALYQCQACGEPFDYFKSF